MSHSSFPSKVLFETPIYDRALQQLCRHINSYKSLLRPTILPSPHQHKMPDKSLYRVLLWLNMTYLLHVFFDCTGDGTPTAAAEKKQIPISGDC